MKSKYVSCLYIAAMLSSMTTFIGCEEIPDGYISDKIIYVQNPFVVQKGIEITTAPPNINGTSYPLKFRLLEAEGPDGQMTTILTDPIATRVWEKPYDFKTDKTIDAINKKITVINAPVMRISESGGQISFSSASTAVPSGEYKISVEMSNSAGTRVYKDIFVAAIQESDPYWMLDGGEGAYSWNSQVGSWGPIEAAGIYDFKHDPDGENEIEFIVCDKNDNPFSWKDGEIVNRGADRRKLEDVCFETPNYTERSAIFKYPFAPFPFAPGGGEQYQYCYRILGNYLKYDDETRSGYMNLVVNFRVLLDGKWTIKVKFPAITRMPKNG